MMTMGRTRRRNRIMILGNEKGKSVNIEMLLEEIRLSGSLRTITDGLQ